MRWDALFNKNSQKAKNKNYFLEIKKWSTYNAALDLVLSEYNLKRGQLSLLHHKEKQGLLNWQYSTCTSKTLIVIRWGFFENKVKTNIQYPTDYTLIKYYQKTHATL